MAPPSIISRNDAESDAISELSDHDYRKDITIAMEDLKTAASAAIGAVSGGEAAAAAAGTKRKPKNTASAIVKKPAKKRQPSKIRQIKIKQQIVTYDVVNKTPSKAAAMPKQASSMASANAAAAASSNQGQSEVITSYSAAIMFEEPCDSIAAVSAAAPTAAPSSCDIVEPEKCASVPQPAFDASDDDQGWSDDERAQQLIAFASSAGYSRQAIKEAWLRSELQRREQEEAEAAEQIRQQRLREEQQQQQLLLQQQQQQIFSETSTAHLYLTAYLEQERRQQQQLIMQERQRQQQLALQQQQLMMQQRQQQLNELYFGTALTAVQNGVTIDHIVNHSGLNQEAALVVAQYMRAILQQAVNGM